MNFWNSGTLHLEVAIYHLLMDQQYDKTKTCNAGKFFAFMLRKMLKQDFEAFGDG